jgi:hypothetical protein
MMAWRLACGLGLALLAGCASGPTLNRWSRAEGVPAYSPPTLFVGSAPTPGGDALSVKALPDRAGAAYIAALAIREKTSKDLRAAVAKEIVGPPSDQKDLTRIGRVLVVSVQRPAPRPGDRFLATTISIRPWNFRFTDYQMAATERTVINIGAVSVADQRSANIALTPGPASAAAEGLAASVAATRTTTAARNIVGAAELSVHVAPERIDIYRTGAEGSDLTGNTLVKLALQLPDSGTVDYAVARPHTLGDDGTVLTPAKATLDVGFLAMAPAIDLYVCARLTYEDRVVTGGGQFYDEGRQTVAIRSESLGWRPFLIVPFQDIETPLWVIASPDGPVQFNGGLQWRTLTFDDYSEAEAFRMWMTVQKASFIGKSKLAEGAVDLPRPIGDFSALHVRRLEKTRGKSQVPDCQTPAGD